MIDFVHLDWKPFKKDPPKQTGRYLCLVYVHDVVPEGKAEIIELNIEKWVACDDYPEECYIYDDLERKYFRESVIAWTDLNSFSFDCNPEKLHRCSTKECVFSNDCSTCHLTTKLEDAKWGDWFL